MTEQPIEKLVETLTDIKEVKGAHLIRPIVPIEQWINSEYYVGPDAKNIYPFWKQHIINIFNSPVKINEVILTGSLGTGKTTIANIILLRLLYELSCYDSIPLVYNLMASSKMAFAYFNVTMSQAEITGYGQLREMIDNSSYFREHFPRNVKKNSAIEFPQANTLVRFASDESHTIGTNLFGSILDEANFYKGDGGSTVTKSVKEVQSKAKKIYTAIRNRGKSRFTKDGVNNSLSILVSSTMYDTSFTEERIQATKDDPHTYVIDAKIWEVKPEGTYSKERFYVFTGTAEVDPFIVRSYQDVNNFFDSIQKERLPEMSVEDAIAHVPHEYTSTFIALPMDFIKDFESNLIQSIQDIAGKSVAPEGRLFQSKEHYRNCLYNYEDGVHITENEKGEQIKIPYTDRAFIQDSFVISTQTLTKPSDYICSHYEPAEPFKKRYLHIDQSLTGDSTGVSCCYLDKVEILPDETVKVYIKVEWMLRIVPPKPPAKIDISKVRSIIPWLSQNKGIQWGMISYDTFASAESIQELEKAGYNVKARSVDRTDEAYLTLIDYIYQGRIKFPKHATFEKELFNLIHYRQQRKVDHPDNGSKDVSDSVAGCIMNLLEDENLTSYLIQNDLDLILDV